jgi:hypothetical protein
MNSWAMTIGFHAKHRMLVLRQNKMSRAITNHSPTR